MLGWCGFGREAGGKGVFIAMFCKESSGILCMFYRVRRGANKIKPESLCMSYCWYQSDLARFGLRE